MHIGLDTFRLYLVACERVTHVMPWSLTRAGRFAAAVLALLAGATVSLGVAASSHDAVTLPAPGALITEAPRWTAAG